MNNPFPNDPDRREIWDMLVARDTEAWCNADWAAVEGDFLAGEFLGLDAGFTSRPDHWRLGFPTLESYRDSWLSSAQECQQVRLVGTTVRELVSRATLLGDIDIQGAHAVAHKKFLGEAEKEGGGKMSLNWQTLYFLRKVEGRWKISGFLGYLAGGI